MDPTKERVGLSEDYEVLKNHFHGELREMADVVTQLIFAILDKGPVGHNEAHLVSDLLKNQLDKALFAGYLRGKWEERDQIYGADLQKE